MIEIDAGIISNMESYRGTLAYVAVMVRGEGCWPTAHLAAAVGCQTAVMREGLEELSRLHPEAVRRKGTEWVVGSGRPSTEGVQILESEAARRKDFLDDVKKYWDHKNPRVPFSMGAADGKAVAEFLKKNREWTRETWRVALRNLAKSEVNHARPVYAWVRSLVEYTVTPLDRYGKPMLNGGGKNGEAATIAQRNREAVERAVANA